MYDGCIRNCLVCGKCKSFSILDSFKQGRTHEPRYGYGVAIDIGTTTIVLALLDLSNGEILERHSFLNPQRIYGPDVISRISAANDGALDDLRRLVTRTVSEGAAELLAARNIQPEQIIDAAVAGNTTMTYLMLGFPCDSLGGVPFKPAFRLADRYRFADVFESEGIDCPLRIAPWFAGFVGGDILYGLLYVQNHNHNQNHNYNQNHKRFIMIDLGTNGEMALQDHSELIVTSTAAGPAFESGQGGASGVIHELARLVSNGIIDETGLLKGESVFTQKNIRDLQLAKSAVRSGLEILLETAGLAYKDFDAVYLAGGIGQAIDINDAVTVGLLPGEWAAIAGAVGNASLGGCVYLLNAPQRSEAIIGALLTAARDINLAEHPSFYDLFMEHMYFNE